MGIPHENKFHFRDGTAVANIEELRAKLEGVSYQEFYHHVNSDKNDFANWIRHVHHEETLADDLEKVTSIVETVEILNDHVHPLPVEQPHEDIQSKIEEEALQIHIPVTDEPVQFEDVPVADPTPEPPKEEADSTPEPLKEEANLNIIEKSLDTKEEEKHVDGEHVLTKKDYTRLIVKDFMYGLLFGLIIGIILGRIIAF